MQFLRWMALLEGTSLVMLVLIAMPLKYAYGVPEAVKLVGPIHGVLFIAFNAVLLNYAGKGHLSGMQSMLGVFASFIPFGTFVYKATILKVKS